MWSACRCTARRPSSAKPWRLQRRTLARCTMRERKDRLSEAIARLKQQGRTEGVPKDVVEETLRRIAESGLETRDADTYVAPIQHRRFAIYGLWRLAAAA